MYIHMKMVDIYKQLNISMLSCCNGFYNDWDIRKNELVGNIYIYKLMGHNIGYKGYNGT